MSRETVGDEVRSGDLTVDALNTSAINPDGGDVRVGSSGTPLTALHVDVDSQPDMTTVTDTRDRGALILTISSGGTQGSGELGPSLAFGGINTTRRRAAITAVQTTSDPDQVGLAFHVHGSTSSANDAVTEALRIDHAGLITGSGTSLGAWTAYTPTLGGTGWALGNGTATGYYCQIGKVVYVRARIQFGSTSTFGTGALQFGVPTTMRNAWPSSGKLHAVVRDASASTNYDGAAAGQVAAYCIPQFPNPSGLGLRSVTSSVPFTIANGDSVEISGIYETA